MNKCLEQWQAKRPAILGTSRTKYETSTRSPAAAKKVDLNNLVPPRRPTRNLINSRRGLTPRTGSQINKTWRG